MAFLGRTPVQSEKIGITITGKKVVHNPGIYLVFDFEITEKNQR